ncbi:MAG: HD-GYP domain-containing protein, partial [Myxococcota bacterium]
MQTAIEKSERPGALGIAEELKVEARSGVEAVVRAMEASDPTVRYHCDRVALLASDLAEALGLSPGECVNVELGASLHDVGKIAIPQQIVLKPGRLTTAERELVAAHPAVGAEIIEPLRLPRTAVHVVLHHHERFDGAGYPAGLSGKGIPLAARIVAVVDAYDAMTSFRTYRRGSTPLEALEELERCSGSQFDPDIVAAF